mmetsp:Transcript_35591/g.117120  ORF Transcript_35591/g.117120 Transcript_35591/m.117120 type:complete len:223 (+) Transcript_35591:202-870(+)
MCLRPWRHSSRWRGQSPRMSSREPSLHRMQPGREGSCTTRMLCSGTCARPSAALMRPRCSSSRLLTARTTAPPTPLPAALTSSKATATSPRCTPCPRSLALRPRRRSCCSRRQGATSPRPSACTSRTARPTRSSAAARRGRRTRSGKRLPQQRSPPRKRRRLRSAASRLLQARRRARALPLPGEPLPGGPHPPRERGGGCLRGPAPRRSLRRGTRRRARWRG